MTALFGRLFQLIALVMLPIGFYVGTVNGNSAVETRLLFIGAGFFITGWLMSRRRS